MTLGEFQLGIIQGFEANCFLLIEVLHINKKPQQAGGVAFGLFDFLNEHLPCQDSPIITWH